MVAPPSPVFVNQERAIPPVGTRRRRNYRPSLTVVWFARSNSCSYADLTKRWLQQAKAKTARGSKTSPKSPKSKKPSSKVGAKAGPLEGNKAGEERDDNGLGMSLVWCPAGEFQMGSPK